MLRPLGNLFVVAPDKARSGSACSLSSEIPVKADLLETSEGLTVYACSGTPVDCVKLALDQLLASRPDLIVGGINHGNNATINVHYSGTLGVAAFAQTQTIYHFTPVNDIKVHYKSGSAPNIALRFVPECQFPSRRQLSWASGGADGIQPVAR